MNSELVENKGARELIVVLSGHNSPTFLGYNSLISLLKKNPNVSLLFCSDPENKYYLGDDGGVHNRNLIKKYVDNYSPENVTFFGPSMGGYAAIYFGTFLNCNIFTSNPQINFGITSALSWHNLRESIAKIPIKVDLNLHLDAFLKESVIYIVHGLHRLDLANMSLLMTTTLKQYRIFIERINDKSHGFYLPELNDLFSAHSTVRDLRNNKFTGINIKAQENINKSIQNS